jgi:3-hydroxyisobutyrate dehydrogenase
MARHLIPGGRLQVLRVHDRGNAGDYRDKCRQAWKEHGAQLVSTFEELIGNGDLDGVFVCCGKNGDDLPIIARLAALLAKSGRPNSFICHMSTVSTSFADLAHEFCRGKNIRYVNYPLTGGASGAAEGTMLILAGGAESTFQELAQPLSAIGTPKYFGPGLASGAEVKFIGHLMVFNGLLGICCAAAVHSECFNSSKIGGTEQTAFFDFLNKGAGGTRQWEVALRPGIESNLWDAGFSLKFAIVDALYLAQLCITKAVSNLVINRVLETFWAFSYILNKVGDNLATQSIVQALTADCAADFDRYLLAHTSSASAPKADLEQCVRSLPDKVRQSACLDISLNDFEKALA